MSRTEYRAGSAARRLAHGLWPEPTAEAVVTGLRRLWESQRYKWDWLRMAVEDGAIYGPSLLLDAVGEVSLLAGDGDPLPHITEGWKVALRDAYRQAGVRWRGPRGNQRAFRPFRLSSGEHDAFRALAAADPEPFGTDPEWVMPDNPRAAEMLRLRADGYTLVEIAETFGWTVTEGLRGRKSQAAQSGWGRAVKQFLAANPGLVARFRLRVCPDHRYSTGWCPLCRNAGFVYEDGSPIRGKAVR